ncbi:MAG: DUF2520 domain-containing protein [candidate division WOR-3 bacterium]|nr:DUF2520 domain-containing protein [candidate division WOR-3 bacterium]MCX7948184.1 DUF2520 domain-containing protein [candidate division WOR-3 bacterium]MDW8151119.1 DUF2520 domain-containing protein [candidate division WOR-3 bacterium]
MRFKIGIIGYGNVGGSIAEFFEKKKRKVLVLTSKNLKSREFVKFYKYNEIESFLENTNVILICIRDDKIENIVEILKNYNLTNKIVYHTSGSLTSDILKPITKAYIGSLHPIQTFPKINYKLLRNIYFSFEGQKFSIAKKLATFFNSKVIRIKKEKKVLYHIACIFASNFSNLLWIISEKMIKESTNKDFKILHPLVKTTLNNALIYGTKDALTGPARRGDYKLIEEHLNFLKNYNLDTYNVYKSLSQIIISQLKID